MEPCSRQPLCAGHLGPNRPIGVARRGLLSPNLIPRPCPKTGRANLPPELPLWRHFYAGTLLVVTKSGLKLKIQPRFFIFGLWYLVVQVQTVVHANTRIIGHERRNGHLAALQPSTDALG